MSVIQEQQKIPVKEARQIVKDLMVPNAFIYWVDFLFHIHNKIQNVYTPCPRISNAKII